MTQIIYGIGLMSGTSLDGLDIAYCEFNWPSGGHASAVSAKIIHAETVRYSPFWKEKLSTAQGFSALDFWSTHVQFGRFMAEETNRFISSNNITNISFVAAHGHTIFHQPQNGFTCQIGDGASLAAITGLPVVCDFRSKDVALGGQGAPLVPIGDKVLFGAYDACLNIGGIANISFDRDEKRVAFDICPANLVMNYYAEKKGLLFDKDGALAKSALPDEKLLQQLNELEFYHNLKQKSIGREWVEEQVLRVMDLSGLSPEQCLSTATEHTAIQIARVINHFSLKHILLSGGGIYNKYLLERISAHTSAQLVIPDDRLVEFKEALIFALLGLLRLKEKPNCLKAVTGATSDNIGGAVYL